MSVPAPRYRLGHLPPGCMCTCGHREGSHNDLGRCVTWNCSCGGFPYAPESMWGGFDPVDGPCLEKKLARKALRDRA